VKDRERIQEKMKKIILVGFEVLTALIMKCYNFWNITPCIPLNINLFFRGRCRFHLQGRRKNQARNKDEAGSNWFLAWLTHPPLRWRRYVLPKLRALCVTARILAMPLKFNLPHLVYKILILSVACKSKHCTIPACGEQDAYL
jgi:hypothetical protein